MARRFKKFKVSRNKKKKIIENKKSENNKRIIGEIMSRNTHVYGSKSLMILPLTIYSLSPYDLHEKKQIEYKKNELNLFKNYSNNNLYTDLW